MAKRFRHRETSAHSVFRVAEILAWLADHPDGASLTAIGRALRRPLSTVYETLRTLVDLRFVVKDAETNRYSMGVRVFEIGMSYLSRTNLVEAFHAAARNVVRATGETVQLAVRDGRDVLHIAEVDATRSVRVVTDIGRRLPCHTASAGKALLACLSDAEIKRLYRNAPLPSLTRRTVSSLPSLLKELHRVRQQGYAVDVQETFDGILCVAAPISGPGGAAVAGISVPMVYNLTNSRRVGDIARVVQSAAAAASHQLSPLPSVPQH